MKITLQEFDGCFGFDIKAETMEEAATLVRMGMNHTQIKMCSANVLQCGTFEFNVVLGKSKRSSPTVPKRK